MRPKITETASSVPSLDQPLPAVSSIPATAQVATARAAADTSTRSKNLMRPDITRLCWRGGDGAELRSWTVTLLTARFLSTIIAGGHVRVAARLVRDQRCCWDGSAGHGGGGVR